MAGDAEADIREQRRAAAEHYRPEPVTTLLVAEAPPSAPERYFYFENVREQDALFRYVARVVLGHVPQRHEKAKALGELRDRGVFLVDLRLDPVDGGPLAAHVPDLIERVRALKPDRVILIKATVYDAALGPMKAAGLPVVNERIPFPGSGQQRRFVEAFTRAFNVG